MSAHIKSDIDTYLAGTLPESRRREVDHHVAQCESCRKTLHKARTRLAHEHREALKRAANETLPNLLMNRLSRTRGEPPRPEGFRWRWILILLALGAAYYGWQYFLPRIETRPDPSPGVVNKPAPISETPRAVAPAAPQAASVDISTAVAQPLPRRRRAPMEDTATLTPPAAPLVVPSALPAPQAPATVEISTP